MRTAPFHHADAAPGSVSRRTDGSPDQPRDERGRWGEGGSGAAGASKALGEHGKSQSAAPARSYPGAADKMKAIESKRSELATHEKNAKDPDQSHNKADHEAKAENARGELSKMEIEHTTALAYASKHPTSGQSIPAATSHQSDAPAMSQALNGAAAKTFTDHPQDKEFAQHHFESEKSAGHILGGTLSPEQHIHVAQQHEKAGNKEMAAGHRALASMDPGDRLENLPTYMVKGI